jgi:IS30 family transposase
MSEYDIDTDKDKPYQDPEVLRKLYHDEFLTIGEVADVLDVSHDTIRRYMVKFGIERRGPRERKVAHAKLLDEEWLREKYHGEGMSITDISEELGVSRMPISRALDRHDIEAHPDDYRSWNLHPSFMIKPDGYYVAYSTRRDENGDKKQNRIRIHRLVAVAEYGVDAVAGNVVHHKNGVPWDNRPENLEVMSKEDHVRHHFNERGGLQPWQG